MKNKIIIEGKEFELPDELVNRIKEELNKPKKLTYDDIIRELINKFIDTYQKMPLFNIFSKKQSEKIIAIVKLMNTSKYLNGDWKVEKFKSGLIIPKFIQIVDGEIMTDYYLGRNSSFTYFKTEELAQEAIDILGEETIRLALSTDW